jgi:SAM-dependent methyltransferase
MKRFRREELRDIWGDEPAMIRRYRRIWESDAALQRFYRFLWAWAMQDLGPGPIIELGGGAGLIREDYPEVITTDLLPFPWTDVVCDASRPPFQPASAGGLLSIGAFHHFENRRRLFEEAARILRPGGRCIIIDPFITPLGSLVQRLGSEEDLDLAEPPLDDGAGGPGEQPLLEANVARATILFIRNRGLFEQTFPELRITKIEPVNLFRHVAAGSLVQKSPLPAWMYPLAECVDRLLHPFVRWTGMCMKAVIEKGS